MLILLPPSEGKAEGGSGPPVDLDGLSWPTLAVHRQRVLSALVAICQKHPVKARTLLGLSEALDADRAANAVAEQSPTMAAGHRYAGVLHDALGYPTLNAAPRRRADASVVVFSGLWGATRPTDLLPAYRVGIATRLPKVGPLPTYWRAPLLDALDEAVTEQGALDLRSSGYALMYRPSKQAASGLITVSVTGPDGRRAAASYQSKVAKGRLVRALLEQGQPTAAALPMAAEAIGLEAIETASGFIVKAPTGWGLIATRR
ncbi:MAG TPA: peroxide stress protein YaaA [Mycobacteriales bacterium]|nr:peroxide stress protein YaaA [Mycobacteriales bacterium]